MSDKTPATQLEPAIIVIFGVTGDLSRRYLLPSLYRLFRLGLLHDQTVIIGASRREVGLDELLDGVELCITETDNVCDPATMDRMRASMRMQQLDMDDPESYRQLSTVIDDVEDDRGVCMNRLYYLSIPPAAYGTVIGRLGESGLNGSCRHGSAESRLLVEKPFGQDLASARELIDRTAVSFNEEQIYRIDHYLAKETAQNITTFRFENPIFENIWNNGHVSRIDIVASEKIGIEGRADFYEGQGALRDFIQNHLLQLLAVSAMEHPGTFDSDSLHAAKLRLLEAVRPAEPARARRGQYTGYTEEVGNPDSGTETFAAIETTIDMPEWQGVPVTIRTGKAMAERRTSITFTFTHKLTEQTNDLVFRIQPEEGIEIGLRAKKPGFDHELQAVHMDFSYVDHFEGLQPNAYERVLVDAVRGDRTLFASSQEVLASWRIIDDVVHDWQRSTQGLLHYGQGTNIDSL